MSQPTAQGHAPGARIVPLLLNTGWPHAQIRRTRSAFRAPYVSRARATTASTARTTSPQHAHSAGPRAQRTSTRPGPAPCSKTGSVLLAPLPASSPTATGQGLAAERCTWTARPAGHAHLEPTSPTCAQQAATGSAPSAPQETYPPRQMRQPVPNAQLESMPQPRQLPASAATQVNRLQYGHKFFQNILAPNVALRKVKLTMPVTQDTTSPCQEKLPAQPAPQAHFRPPRGSSAVSCVQWAPSPGTQHQQPATSVQQGPSNQCLEQPPARHAGQAPTQWWLASHPARRASWGRIWLPQVCVEHAQN